VRDNEKWWGAPKLTSGGRVDDKPADCTALSASFPETLELRLAPGEELELEAVVEE
jgi:hypothetical protein